MAEPQTKSPVRIPLPVLGYNALQPLEAMDPRYAAWMENFNAESQSLEVRPGYAIQASLFGIVAGELNHLASHGDDTLFVFANPSSGNCRIYNVTTSTPSLSHTTGSTVASSNVAKFMGRTAFLAESDAANAARVYDGSSWSAWGFTSGGSPIGATSATEFKGRVYFVLNKSLYYGGFEAVTGAVTELDLEAFLEEDSNFWWVATLSSPNQSSAGQYLAMGTAGGEVLVYAGSFPGAADWELVGKLHIPKLLNKHSYIEVYNDIWVMTVAGVVSIRRALEAGSDDFNRSSISQAINPHWAKLIEVFAASDFPIEAGVAFWPEKNKVYFKVAGYLERDGTNTATDTTMFVYNGFTGSWSVHRLNLVPGDVGNVSYLQNNIYFVSGIAVRKVSAGVYKDETAVDVFEEYATLLDFAYSQLGKQQKWKKVQTVEPVLTTDFAGSKIGIGTATDFGRKVSTITKVALQDGTNQPTYQPGGEGEYIQVRISGTSDEDSEDGYKLFSMGVSTDK